MEVAGPSDFAATAMSCAGMAASLERREQLCDMFCA